MMEVEHKRLLRKLEGDKDRKGYIQIMAESQMGLSDYFIPSTYKDSSGKKTNATKSLNLDVISLPISLLEKRVLSLQHVM